MSMKRTVALILCIMMLVTAMPVGVFAFPTNTEDSFATDKTYGYFYKYDFDGLAEGTAMTRIYTGAGADANPYGYKTDGGFPGTVKTRTDSSGGYQGRYAEVSFSAGTRHYAVFAHGKDGKSFVMGNTVSTEFDIRWQGVIEGATLAANPSFELLSFKRNNNTNSTIVFLTATIVAEDTAIDKYLCIKTPDGTEIARLTKDADDFTNIKTVYYDATQTYSVYINGSLAVEAKAGTRDTITNFINFTYDDDGFVTPTTVSDGYGFFFCNIDNKSQNIAPCVIDVDNFCIKEEQVSDGRTAYYENSFEGTYGDLVVASHANTFTYEYTRPTQVYRPTNTGYLNMGSGGYFLLRDRYQILQNGNWTVEFDARVTSTGMNFILLGFNDGVNDTPLVNVDKTGQVIKFGANTVVNGKLNQIVTSSTMATYGAEKWTHIALSVNVDKNGANKGKFDDWTLAKGDTGLTYAVSLWVDGVYAGSYNDIPRAEFYATSASELRFIDGTVYKRDALATEPQLSDIKDESVRWIEKDSATLKQYVVTDTTTGNETRYYLQYDENGNFIPGSLDETAMTASGSVVLTYSGTYTGDGLGFFDSRGARDDGDIDNIKVYEGLYPAANAVGKNDTKGTVAEIDLGYVITTNAVNVTATQSSTGGDVGVVYFGNWASSSAIASTQNDNAYVTLKSSGPVRYLDVYTPNVGGKVFSSQVKLRNYAITAGSTHMSLLSVKRQEAEGTQTVLNTLMMDTSGYLYFTKDSTNYYLYDMDGNQYSASGSDWITVQTVIDETGDTPLISYLVNGKAAYYYKYTDFPYPVSATNIDGVITGEVTALKDAIDQRVCIAANTGALAYSVDLDTFKVELIENPFPAETAEWEDSAMIDFSDYKSIDELGPQFYRTSGVKIEDGVLVIPEGETFAWIDYNGSFNKKYVTTPATGFNFEVRAKTSTAEGYLIKAVYDTGNGFNFANLDGNYVKLGDTTTNFSISSLEDGRFTDFVMSFGGNSTRPVYFVNGNLVGSSLGNYKANTENEELVAFEFPDKTEISELYIHSGLKSELAEKSGNIISIDPDVITNHSSHSVDNVISMKSLSAANTVTPTEGDKYFSMNYGTACTTPVATDIPFTGYLEDSVTVFETSVRFAPAATIPDKTPNMKLFQLFRYDVNYDVNNTLFAEDLLDITPEGQLLTPYGLLREKDGTALVLSAEDWQNVAVIYDAAAGQISYRVDGNIPYCTVDGSLVIADGVQLKTPSYYRMDAAKAQLRTAYIPTKAIGKLELEYVKAYNVNESANIEFIGTQASTSDGDIRIIAGIDMLYYGCAGFDVKGYGYDELGNPKDGESMIPANTAYSSITEVVNGAENVVYPEEYGYRYFLIGKITKIPQDKAVTLEITPYTMTSGKKSSSAKILLNVDFSELDMNNWVCATDCVSIKPEGDDIKANFSTTEYVAYTKDGALELNGLNAEFAFSANCEGQVSVNLTNAFGEAAEASLFDVYVNGERTKENVSLDFGHHTFVLADNLAKGDYTFKLVKKSGDDFVRINSMNFCGTIGEAPLLVRENAVDVVVS